MSHDLQLAIAFGAGSILQFLMTMTSHTLFKRTPRRRPTRAGGDE